MSVIGGYTLMQIGLMFGALFGVALVWDLIFEDAVEDAFQRALGRYLGLATGAGSILVMAAVMGLEALMQVPTLIVGAIGLGGLAGWFYITPGAFGAIALVVFTMGHAVHGRYT